MGIFNNRRGSGILRGQLGRWPGQSGEGDNGAPSDENQEIPSVLHSAFLAAFGALAWVFGADLVQNRPGTPVQFVASVVSGFIGGPLGLLLTGILNDELVGVTLGTIVTGMVYTLIAGMAPQDQNNDG
ncbi:MAG: hypothetical protein HPY52_01245 [Firmicutes bacterium]|nr:hypothetical protein [Bacillota bacterium]